MQQIIISNMMTGGESANVHEEEEQQVEMKEEIEHENEHEKHDEEW